MSVTPYIKTQYRLAPEGAYWEYQHQNGRKTTMPHRALPQPYSMSYGRVKTWASRTAGGTYFEPKNPTSRSAHESKYLPFGSGTQALRNKAYDRLLSRINGDQAAIGVAMAEHKESFGMIANRSMGLYRAYKNLRKGDFRGCLRELSVKPKRKHKNLVRSGADEASGLWLEYWFGWSPFLSDIDTAARQTSEPFPAGEAFRGRAKGRYVTQTSNQKVITRYQVETGCTARLVNPNLYLASQLGLTNPASIAWEIVPFSFLVDWVFDVSSYLGSYTDFVGLDISKVYTSETARCEWTWDHRNANVVGTYSASQTFMERRLQLVRPLPNSEVLDNLGSSITRAASAVSLLTQILGGRT